MDVFKDHKIIRSLGVGATSEVFLAESPEGKTIALKVFNPSSFTNHEQLQRLRTEHDVLISMEHPHVVRTFALLSEGTRMAIALEYMEGGDLRQWMARYSLPLIEPKLWILAQVARGLGAAHERGILHRDLKPENVLLSKQGEVKITDFGVAKFIDRTTQTQHGLLIGSLGFLAPEVIDGKSATTLSDIFSFGVLAYELLAGEPAFGGHTAQEILKSTVLCKVKPLAPLGIDRGIAALIESCISANPSLRPKSIWQIEAEIMGYIQKQTMFPLIRQVLEAEKFPRVAGELAFIKREQLLVTMRGLAEAKVIDHSVRDLWLAYMREFQTLFPNDTGWEASKSVLNARKKNYIVPAAVLFCLVVFNVAWWIKGAGAPSIPAAPRVDSAPVAATVPTAMTAPPATTAPPAVTAQTAAPDATPSTQSPPTLTKQSPRPEPATEVYRPTRRAEISQTGRLRFKVPLETDIYVDGDYVDHGKTPSLILPVGTHSLKMAKKGFLPIENEIHINSGKETLIQVE